MYTHVVFELVSPAVIHPNTWLSYWRVDLKQVVSGCHTKLGCLVMSLMRCTHVAPAVLCTACNVCICLCDVTVASSVQMLAWSVSEKNTHHACNVQGSVPALQVCHCEHCVLFMYVK